MRWHPQPRNPAHLRLRTPDSRTLGSRSRPHLPAQSSQPIGTSATQPGRATEPVLQDASPAPRGSSGPRAHQVHSLSPSSASSRRGAAAAVSGGAVSGGAASAPAAAPAAARAASSASMARRCLKPAPAAQERSERRGNAVQLRAEEGRSRRFAPSRALCPPRGRPREGHGSAGSSRCLAAVASSAPPARWAWPDCRGASRAPSFFSPSGCPRPSPFDFSQISIRPWAPPGLRSPPLATSATLRMYRARMPPPTP